MWRGSIQAFSVSMVSPRPAPSTPAMATEKFPGPGQLELGVEQARAEPRFFFAVGRLVDLVPEFGRFEHGPPRCLNRSSAPAACGAGHGDGRAPGRYSAART
jgi:hypothetical protein